MDLEFTNGASILNMKPPPGKNNAYFELYTKALKDQIDMLQNKLVSIKLDLEGSKRQAKLYLKQ